LRRPTFVSKLVPKGDAGEIVSASLSRLNCEMYPLTNRDTERAKAPGKPQERLARLQALLYSRAAWKTLMPGGRQSPNASAAG
jgi:hypothetical protein